MKFKREKQKLIIELNTKEETYLKDTVDYWMENIQTPKEDIQDARDSDARDNLMENFNTFLETKKPCAEYETRGWGE